MIPLPPPLGEVPPTGGGEGNAPLRHGHSRASSPKGRAKNVPIFEVLMLNIKTLPLGDNQTNCYLVWGKNANTCVVIDPGYAPEYILEQVAALGKTVEAIFLTHCHFDHVGAVKQIAKETACHVFVNQKEWAMPASWLFPINGTAIDQLTFYKEGDKLALAGTGFSVMETPGHTPGCVCLLCKDVIFTGDTLFCRGYGRTDFKYGSDLEMIASLRRLSKLPGEVIVLSGHGGATTIGDELC